MNILLIRVLPLVLFTGINADSTKRSEKIQTLIQNLVNISPNVDKIHNLCNPLKLQFDEYLKVDEYVFYKHKTTFKFQNVTTSKFINKNPASDENYYIEFKCTFHQQLQISHAIEPENITIQGQYQIQTFDMDKLTDNFIAKQHSGRIIHKISNTSNKTELLYSNGEINVSKSGDNRHPIIEAIGEAIEEVKNHTLAKINKTYLLSKINDFQHIFPFLKNCLSAENRTANRLPQNTYYINNTVTEKWKSFKLSIPRIIIYGINDFKLVTITAQSNANSVVRFNMNTFTNSLEGHFIWLYIKTDNTSSKHHFNFTIEHLILTANANFKDEWSVNNVDAKIGEIRIHRTDTKYPDVNEFMFNILLEHLKILITAHLKKRIQDEYSPKLQTSFDESGIPELEAIPDSLFKQYEPKSIAKPSTDRFNARGTPDTSYLYQKNLQNPPNHPKPVTDQCLDGRKNLLQKIFFYRPPCNLTETNPGCVDNRRWFNIFYRNPCKTNNETIPGCKDTRKWYNIFSRNPCKK